MKQTAKHQTSETMEVFTGFCPTGKGGPVVGRLVRKREAGSALWHGACITVSRTLPSPTEESNAVGTVLVGSLALPWEYLHTCRTPILMVSELPSRCFGRIALLDPSLGRLFVSPDFETVSQYAPLLDTEESVSAESVAAEVGGVCLHRAVDRDSGKRQWLCNGGWVQALRDVGEGGEDRLYEQYCDLADSAAGSPIAILLTWCGRQASDELFRRQIRSIFRAAVYGRFSLLLENFLQGRDFEECLACIHRIFCELESEGREFNGYIPKGILLDRPIQLSPRFGSCRADLTCVDAERMLTALTGCSPWECDQLQREDWQMAVQTIADAPEKRTVGLDVLFREHCPCRPLVRCWQEMGVQTWYLTGEAEQRLAPYLRELDRE